MKEYCERSLSVLRYSFVLVYWNSSRMSPKFVHQRLCYKRAPKRHVRAVVLYSYICKLYICNKCRNENTVDCASASVATVVNLKFFLFHEENRICAGVQYILIYILWERLFNNIYFLHKKNRQIISLPSIYFVPLLELWLNGKIKWDLSRWLSADQWQHTMV